MENIIVGISGASGDLYSIGFCLALKKVGINPIVVMTDSAEKVVELENDYSLTYNLRQHGIRFYRENDVGAPCASGSFKTKGMIVYPCSIASLSKIAYSNNSNLLVRSADVTLKEGRKLILVVRETPLHIGHIELMRKVCEMGGVIMPLMFSFYQKRKENLTILDYFSHFNGRILDQFDINNDLVERWKGE